MTEKIKVPDIIDVKIGSKAEREWTNLLDTEETNLVKSEMNVEIGSLVVNLAKKRIAEEQEKFKPISKA